MLHDLYSVGYLNPLALDLLQERVDQGATVLDIRLIAGSRYRPDFSSKRLRERFGSAYLRVPELGNKNYNRPGAPIVLVQPEQGIARLLTLLEQHDVCLLCRCQRVAICHTTTVVSAARRLNPNIHLIRLGERANLSGDGQSTQKEPAMTLDELLALKAQTSKPKTYCLCGSTGRAAQAFQAESLRLTLAGHKVLSIGVNARDQDLGITEAQKIQLDILHLYKVEDADVVRILNVGGYIGESTRRELEYARRLGKLIEFLEEASA